MKKDTVVDLAGRETIADPLTEMQRTGARELIEKAVEIELQELLEEHCERRTEDGRAGVVRSGYLPERELQTGVGPVTIRIPKVRAKTGEPVTFRSALVPPYVRKTRALEAALPWLYLKGVSNGEMGEALKVLVAADLRAIYAAPTREEAGEALERFAEKWDGRYPAISPSWWADWERLTVFFDYPPEIRKVIYTTNAIESLNYSLRKVLKYRGAFPSDESILKVLYLGMQNVAKKWSMPIRDWKAALNQFVILFGDRVPD
jgi:transposase-like protein